MKALIRYFNQQLQNWFYNNRDNRIHGAPQVKPLNLKVKQSRTLSAIQLYSAAKYDENVKESVHREIQENAVPKNKVIEVIKQKMIEKFLAEPVEVQEQFRDQSKKLKEEHVRAKQGSKAELNLTPVSYAVLVFSSNSFGTSA